MTTLKQLRTLLEFPDRDVFFRKSIKPGDVVHTSLGKHVVKKVEDHHVAVHGKLPWVPYTQITKHVPMGE
jgi:hypothetical protein